MFIKRFFFFDSDETEIRLSFYTSFSTFWNRFGGFYDQAFYSWTWVGGDVKSSVL